MTEACPLNELGPMPQAARDFIVEIARLKGIDPRLIVSPCRYRMVYRTRVEVARYLDARGYSSTRIGAILNHDHTTVVFYLGRGQKAPPPLRWKRPKVRTLKVLIRPSRRKTPLLPQKLQRQRYAGWDNTERHIEGRFS